MGLGNTSYTSGLGNTLKPGGLGLANTATGLGGGNNYCSWLRIIILQPAVLHCLTQE